ncbi:MAG: vWA domain-containing protein [Polyangiaceae bacterium]
MPRSLLRPALVASALLVPEAAFAQWNETSSGANVELYRNRAEVSVMVSISNDSETAVEAQLGVSIGSGAATGLALLSPWGANLWQEAELERGDAAMLRYTQMAEAPVGAKPLSAILAWGSAGYLDLYASVPAKGQQVVSYKFVAPVTYSGGHYHYELSALDYSVPGWVNVRVAEKGGALVADEIPSPDGRARLTIDAGHSLAWTVPVTDPVFGEIAVLPKSGQAAAASTNTAPMALVDYHLDVAPRVAEIPEHARIVVLIDASRSLDDADGTALFLAAQSYVHAFDGHDAKVALVTFDRSARLLDPATGFAPAADAEAALAARASATNPRGNGSNLDVALAKAGELLAPEAGPKRVVLFTDLHTADRLTAESVTPHVPAGAILHVVAAGAGLATLERDDTSPWAPLARATGGLVWSAAAADDDAVQRSVFEELARPKAIDHARVSPAPDANSDGQMGRVDEGTRIASSAFRAADGATVTIDGELWSQPLHKVFGATAAYRKLAAGLVFADGAFEDLDPETMLAFANLGHVVSPVTSLVAKDAANAPFDRDAIGRGGFGGGSIGTTSCCCTMPTHTQPAPLPAVDTQGFLDREVAAIKLACDPSAKPKVSVESTLDEIVDVHVDGASSQAASECMTEKVWALVLDRGFRAYDHLVTES